MEEILKIFYILVLVFLVLTLITNFLWTRHPKIPGDLFFDKSGFNVYIPFTSSIVISVLLTMMFNYFMK